MKYILLNLHYSSDGKLVYSSSKILHKKPLLLLRHGTRLIESEQCSRHLDIFLQSKVVHQIFGDWI